MTQKTRILAAIMAVLVLVGSLALAVSADGETRSEPTEKELPTDLERLPAENSRETADVIEEHNYGYRFSQRVNDSTNPYNVALATAFPDEPNYIDVLFSDGTYYSYYLTATRGAAGSGTLDYYVVNGFLRSSNTLNVAMDDTESFYTVRGSGLYSFSTYYNNTDFLFFSPVGLFYVYWPYEGNNIATVVSLNDAIRFRYRYEGTGQYFCFGCTSSDFVTPIEISDIPTYALGLSNNDETEQTTLTDWFFDTAFPVFGSVDTDSIDLGILGNYQPIQLYKFLFSLSLVVVAIVLLVWLPTYGLFRLLGIKRKKR